MIYIIEDNGVYGLTKGQFSATADIGSKLKTGVINDLPAIDTCSLAIQLGATFVGRSFSGDKKQLLTMLKAAIAHKGTVMLDVISPCVTFNDHEGSTRSYKYMQEHDEPITEVGFVPFFEEIDVEYDPGTTLDVTMHDGSSLRLRKLHEDYDPTDRAARREDADGSARKGRSPHRRLLHRYAEAHLHRPAEPGGRAAGHPAAGAHAPRQAGAGRHHGTVEVGKSSPGNANASATAGALAFAAKIAPQRACRINARRLH